MYKYIREGWFVHYIVLIVCIHWQCMSSRMTTVINHLFTALNSCIFFIITLRFCRARRLPVYDRIYAVAMTLSNFSWLHGKINRQKVARLLSSGAEGLYLIRESTKFAGEYTLSMNSHQSPAGGPDHYTIKRRQQKFTIDGANYFISLHELIEVSDVKPF